PCGHGFRRLRRRGRRLRGAWSAPLPASHRSCRLPARRRGKSSAGRGLPAWPRPAAPRAKGATHAWDGSELPYPIIARPALFRAERVEGEVELQHIHVRLTENPEKTALGIVGDQLADLDRGKAPRLGDARRLKQGRRRGDVGVESAGRI